MGPESSVDGMKGFFMADPLALRPQWTGEPSRKQQVVKADVSGMEEPWVTLSGIQIYCEDQLVAGWCQECCIVTVVARDVTRYLLRKRDGQRRKDVSEGAAWGRIYLFSQ